MSVGLRLLCAGVAVIGGIVLPRARRDYEQHRRLSAATSALGWTGYVVHTAAVVLAASRSVWRLPLPLRSARAAGLLLAAGGAVIFAAGVSALRSFAQMSGTRNEGLVTGGVYRFSRNPQNVGWGLALGGVAVTGISGFALLLVVAFALFVRLYLRTEEQHMHRTFGEEWERYAAQVPRVLGRPRVTAVAPSRTRRAAQP